MTEQLKYFGFLVMVLDHVTLLYFPQFYLGRFIGRLAAPLFFYCLVIGFRRTKNLSVYLYRLLTWAVVSQLIIWCFIGFKPYLNILFSLAWALIFLRHFNERISYLDKFFLIILFSASAELFNFEYGIYSIIFVALFNYYRFDVQWLLAWLLFVFAAFHFNFFYFFVLPVPLLIFAFERMSFNLPRLNFYFLYSFQWLFLALPLFFKQYCLIIW